MPPLLCPGPIILDHTFPRSERELQIVATALGNLVEHATKKSTYLILSDTLRNFVIDLNWENTNTALLVEVHRFLIQLFLHPHPNVRMLSVAEIEARYPHPIPSHTSREGRVSLWASELGKLLVLHDSRSQTNGYFIGVACERAFAGLELGTYSNDESARRAFPLVGPEQLADLEDCYEWEVPASAHRITIGFGDVQRNYPAIGAIGFEKPSGGSHYKVRFRDGKCWPCDKNWGKSIGENMLDELKQYCSYPLPVIKIALSCGSLPKRRFRLDT